jgi:hypothetical protein
LVTQKEIERKTEEELIEMAGPATASIDARALAAYELEVSISRSKKRVDIYLLTMNDLRDTALRESIGGCPHRAVSCRTARHYRTSASVA